MKISKLLRDQIVEQIEKRKLELLDVIFSNKGGSLDGLSGIKLDAQTVGSIKRKHQDLTFIESQDVETDVEVVVDKATSNLVALMYPIADKAEMAINPKREVDITIEIDILSRDIWDITVEVD